MSGLLTRYRRQVLLVATAATAMALAPAATASAANGTFGYQGNAFGTAVQVAGVVTSDPTAVVSFGCGTPAGFDRTVTTAGVDVPPGTLNTGTITSNGQTSESPTFSRTSSTVEDVSVLGGLVTANAVTSVSTTSNDGDGFSVSDEGTRFAGLRVLGLPVLVGTDPNTRITLPGVGFVIINQQQSQVGDDAAGLRVTALRAVVTVPNLLGFDVGTTVVVAQAFSALTAPTEGFLAGFAYGTAAQVGPILESSPSFPVMLPCAGTDGVVRERNGAGVNLPGIVNSGTIRNTAVGTATATTATAQLTSTIEDVSLLGGVVEATGIVSVANATSTSGVKEFSDEGSSFASVSVNGEPLVVADIEPNTRINLVGIGTLHLRRTVVTANGIEVRAIELVVLQGSPGLPVGTTVRVAVANAQVR